MYPISKEETYENKVNILRFITENIPLYVCLREGLKDELKYCYFDFTGKELTDEMINKYI